MCNLSLWRREGVNPSGCPVPGKGKRATSSFIDANSLEKDILLW